VVSEKVFLYKSKLNAVTTLLPRSGITLEIDVGRDFSPVPAESVSLLPKFGANDMIEFPYRE